MTGSMKTRKVFDVNDLVNVDSDILPINTNKQRMQVYYDHHMTQPMPDDDRGKALVLLATSNKLSTSEGLDIPITTCLASDAGDVQCHGCSTHISKSTLRIHEESGLDYCVSCYSNIEKMHHVSLISPIADNIGGTAPIPSAHTCTIASHFSNHLSNVVRGENVLIMFDEGSATVSPTTRGKSKGNGNMVFDTPFRKRVYNNILSVIRDSSMGYNIIECSTSMASPSTKYERVGRETMSNPRTIMILDSNHCNAYSIDAYFPHTVVVMFDTPSTNRKELDDFESSAVSRVAKAQPRDKPHSKVLIYHPYTTPIGGYYHRDHGSSPDCNLEATVTTTHKLLTSRGGASTSGYATPTSNAPTSNALTSNAPTSNVFGVGGHANGCDIVTSNDMGVETTSNHIDDFMSQDSDLDVVLANVNRRFGIRLDSSQFKELLNMSKNVINDVCAGFMLIDIRNLNLNGIEALPSPVHTGPPSLATMEGITIAANIPSSSNLGAAPPDQQSSPSINDERLNTDIPSSSNMEEVHHMDTSPVLTNQPSPIPSLLFTFNNTNLDASFITPQMPRSPKSLKLRFTSPSPGSPHKRVATPDFPQNIEEVAGSPWLPLSPTNTRSLPSTPEGPSFSIDFQQSSPYAIEIDSIKACLESGTPRGENPIEEFFRL